MNAISGMITSVFDLILLAFGRYNHTIGLVGLSLITGALMALIFKWTSNPNAIRKAKDRLKARILEMRIYQDDPRLIIRGFFGAMGANGFYLAAIIKPFLILLVPVVIVFMQMDERYTHRHLPLDSSTVLSVELKDGLDPYTTDVALSIEGNGVLIDTKPVRVRETREVDWRLHTQWWGTHRATLTADGESYSFPLVTQQEYRMIGNERGASSFIEPLLSPGLEAIPASSPFARISINYPSASYPFLIWHVHWIVIFIIYSFISALILKFLLNIEI